jgi:hypothetical protein
MVLRLRCFSLRSINTNEQALSNYVNDSSETPLIKTRHIIVPVILQTLAKLRRPLPECWTLWLLQQHQVEYNQWSSVEWYNVLKHLATILWGQAGHTVHGAKCFSQLWKGLAPWSNERLSWFSNGFACTAGNYQSTWKTIVKAPILLLSCHHISYDVETDQLLQFLSGLFLWIIMLEDEVTY